MTTIIGPLTLPDTFHVRRAGGSISGRPAQITMPGSQDVAYHTGTNLPRYRYTGWMQTKDSAVALNWMRSLRELFRSQEIDYPLYINADKKFYFQCNSFSYERPGGYREYFTFTLDVTWVGTEPFLVETYITETEDQEENDWNL